MTTTNPQLLVQRYDAVAVLTMNRPRALNALSDSLVQDIGRALDDLEADPAIRCIVLTGSERAFAAGADVVEMLDKTYMDAFFQDFITGDWERVAACRKPLIAAVAGKALGGGCELAMMCDVIVAADNASFGLPEILVGTLGGIQRLTRAVGKSKAMEMILSGQSIDADAAERAGLVARVVPLAELHEQALALAQQIAAQSLPVLMMAKECANVAFETSLAEGLRFERRVFHATFAMHDRREGMMAFREKRPPQFAHE